MAALVPPTEPVERSTTSATAPGPQSEGRTRDLVTRCVMESGPLTAAELAARLGLSSAAIRRHLDALVAEDVLQEVQPRGSAARRRSRGRPARAYRVTEIGRAGFTQSYDDLAKTALRYLRSTGGDSAVRAFADHRAASLADTLRDHVDAPAAPAFSGGAAAPDPADRLQPVRGTELRVALITDALTAQGYAANVEPAGHGLQICQHHCPVAHVAAEFPELCEAETRALADVLGTYVQRLATIAHGDGVCTTHVPLPSAVLGNQKPDPTPSPQPEAGRHQ